MKSLLLIINPVAGRGTYKNGLGEALHTLHSAGYAPTVRFTTRAGEAVDLAAQSAGYDLLCCMGGDGTLSDVVEGLMRLDEAARPPVGYFPLGTANDVASTLGLPKGDSPACARIIAGGEARAWDVGDMGGGRYFTYIAAFGAFTDVSYETPQQNKQALGHLAYVIEGVARLPKLAAAHAVVEYDGGVIEGDFIFGGVTNSTSLAGMIHLDEELVSLSDGEFELLLVRTPQNFVDLQAAFTEFLNKNYDGEQIKLLHTREVRFSFPQPVAWTRDGENGGEHSEVHLKNIHNAIRIRVSPDRC